MDVGPATFIGLSTVRFRCAAASQFELLKLEKSHSAPTASAAVSRVLVPGGREVRVSGSSREPALRCRSNPFSVHEVHVDEEQLAFFRSKLREAGEGHLRCRARMRCTAGQTHLALALECCCQESSWRSAAVGKSGRTVYLSLAPDLQVTAQWWSSRTHPSLAAA